MSARTSLHTLLEAYEQEWPNYGDAKGLSAPKAFEALRKLIAEIEELRLFAVQATEPLAAETAYRVAAQFEHVMQEALS